MTVALETPSRNLTRLSGQDDWIVCGWFTDDPVYRPLAEQLAGSLGRVGDPYELVSVPKLSGGWETNTRQKPTQLLAMMDRHPGRTIVLIDVDYTATASLNPLTAYPGDIALQMVARRRASGATRLIASAQVIVVKPTATARKFVETWLQLSSTPFPGDTAEVFLALAVGTDCGCTISCIGQDVVNSMLIHHWASSQTTRMNGFLREAAHVVLKAKRAVIPG